MVLQSLDKTSASSLDHFRKTFGAIREFAQKRIRGHIPNGRGYVESYLKAELVVVVHFRSWRDLTEKYLVLHHVPRRFRDDDPRIQRHDAWRTCYGGMRQDLEPDSMLIIRKMGDLANCIITPGVSITSRIWLFPPYDFVKFGRDDLPLIEARGEVVRSSTPRKSEVSSPRNFMDGGTRREKALVEGIPYVLEGLIGLPFQSSRQGITEAQLVNLIEGLRLQIDDSHIGVTWVEDRRTGLLFEELSKAGLELVDCFPCPADAFLRTIECA